MGNFPDYIVKEFAEMLDYFGQSPIIVRSSSLLEDNYGNAFAGKYESVFCANQGPHQKRLQDFMSAVQDDLRQHDEREGPALSRPARPAGPGRADVAAGAAGLGRRATAACSIPQVAGVGLSRNPYVWNECIDPEAGVLRLVFGLGTRAVDRSDDDYTRVVALNAPERRPESDFDEVRQYSQRKVDVIDLEANQLVSHEFTEVAAAQPAACRCDIFASGDAARCDDRAGPSASRPSSRGVLTFEHLLSRDAVRRPTCGEMLRTLQEAYDYPVDVEFTANFFDRDRYKINLVQCRPLQVVSDSGGRRAARDDRAATTASCEAHGAVIGQSRVNLIDRLVYVSAVGLRAASHPATATRWPG